MRHRLLPIVVALPLAIAGCSNPSTESAPSTSVETWTSQESTTSKAPGKPTEVDLGETINLTSFKGEASDIDLTINDISLTEHCPIESDVAENSAEDGYFLRLEGTVDIKESVAEFTLSEDNFTAMNAKDEELETKLADDCAQSERVEENSDFSGPVSEGETSFGFLELWVSDIPEVLRYSVPGEEKAFVWSVPEIAEPTNSSAPATEPTPMEEAAPADVAEEPYVVECIFGTPGPARWSDGTMAYSDYCFYANGGPEYLEAESQSGLDSASTWDGYDPYPFRSDGCVGPAAVCGYYDDNGDPIWFDKTTGESSPRYYDEYGNPTMDPAEGSVQSAP